MVTEVTYKSKTVQKVLTEIAGLLVLTTILKLLLGQLHEWSFNRKIMKETKIDFREIFSFSNFKNIMDENQEMKKQIQEMKTENQEIKSKMD